MLAAAGVVVWYRGGYLLPLPLGDLKVAIPIQYLLVILGIVTLALPDFTFKLFTAFLPPRVATVLEEKWPIKDQTPETATPAELATFVQSTVKRFDRRYYITLAVVILLVLIIPASIYLQYASKADFRRASRRLARIAQEAPLDFSAADAYRSISLDTDAAVGEYDHTATYELHHLLRELYPTHVVDPVTFEKNLATVYDSRIRRKVIPSYGTLPREALDVPFDASLDAKDAKVALLTLLGVMCNAQGDQGAYIQPYVVGRQLLREALLAAGSSDTAPLTHNALGVNYVGCLMRHSEYERLFVNTSDVVASLKTALGEAAPLRPLALARLANDEYEIASNTATNNFARARYLNNRTDLRLALIAAVHLRGAHFDRADPNDAVFLNQHVDPPPTDGPPRQLWKIFTDLRNDLNAAVRLSRDPHILFTRAQLASVNAQLCHKYEVPQVTCNRPELERRALADLESARSMQLPARWFTAARSSDLLLEWLWQNEGTKAAMARLARED